MDLSDTTSSAPLDLSVKTGQSGSRSLDAAAAAAVSSSSVSASASSDSLETLHELANLQKRFIDSTTIQNYADQLQKVANGPTIQGSLLTGAGQQHQQHHSNGSSGGGASVVGPGSNNNNYCPKLVPPLWPCDWASLYRSIPLQYQMAAYSLLSSNYANLLHAAGGKPPHHLLPDSVSGAAAATTSSDTGGHKRSLGGRTKYTDNVLPAAAAPPEAFGISMRGNQKYSAYYQRPFLVPLGPAPGPGGGAKRSAVGPTESVSSGRKQPSAATPSSSGQSAIAASSALPDVASDERPSNQPHRGSRETAFVCSCGEEFENLYIFTLHMKESNHSPKTAQNYRDIPKLVRGQDMWINSETEQTREILRCMHCQQSFRTLPDLTMHMIRTNHYSEIVYSDSGRCVFVNSDDNNSSSGGGKRAERGGAKRPNLVERSASSTASDASPTKRAKLEVDFDVNGNENMTTKTKSRTAVSEDLPPEAKSTESAPGAPASASSVNDRTEEADVEKNESEEDETPAEEEEEKMKKTKKKKKKEKQEKGWMKQEVNSTTEVTEADSATADSGSGCTDPPDPIPAATDHSATDSVIRQIESFVEKSLPRSLSHHTNSKIGASEGSSAPSMVVAEKGSGAGEKEVGKLATGAVPYVAPDAGNRPAENPLSSLQKLVETTHNKPEVATGHLKSAASMVELVKGGSTPNKAAGQASQAPPGSPPSVSPQTLCSVGSLSSPFGPHHSPTVIMVNPTYIYQPAFATLPHQMYPPYPWYPSLPVYGAGMGTMEDVPPGSTDSPPPSKAAGGRPDSRSPSAERPDDVPPHLLPQLSASVGELGDIHRAASTTTTSAACGSGVAPSTTTSTNNSGSVIVKKAKCNYCGKPFANKGQVRLHISKGKCPSLMQTCHNSGGSVSAIMSSPFAYMPLDYVDRAAANSVVQAAAAAQAAGSTTVSAAAVAADERLKLYYSLVKQLSGSDSH